MYSYHQHSGSANSTKLHNVTKREQKQSKQYSKN